MGKFSKSVCCSSKLSKPEEGVVGAPSMAAQSVAGAGHTADACRGRERERVVTPLEDTEVFCTDQWGVTAAFPITP